MQRTNLEPRWIPLEFMFATPGPPKNTVGSPQVFLHVLLRLASIQVSTACPFGIEVGRLVVSFPGAPRDQIEACLVAWLVSMVAAEALMI